MKARAPIRSGCVETRRSLRVAILRSSIAQTRWRQRPRKSRNQKIGVLISRHHQPAIVRELPSGDIVTAQDDLGAKNKNRSETDVTMPASTKQTLSAVREPRCRRALDTAA